METKAYGSPLSHQGVCELHDTEELCVTHGDLIRFSSEIEIRKSISASEMSSNAL